MIQPDLSILVPTSPARAKFWPWLAWNIKESLRALDYRWEAEIVVCQGDTVVDCIREEVGHLAPVRGLPFLGGFHEIAAKRNLLQKSAQGRYIAWMDDDDYRDPQWFACALRRLESPESAYAGATARGIYYFDIERWMYWRPRQWTGVPIPITTVVRNKPDLPTFGGGNGEDVRWYNALSPHLCHDISSAIPIMAISHGGNTSRWLDDERVREAFKVGLPPGLSDDGRHDVQLAELHGELLALQKRLREP